MFGLTSYNDRALAHGPFSMLDAWEKELFGHMTGGSFRTDIRDMGDSFLLEAELPGFKKEDITISADGACLTVSAEHTEDSGEKQADGQGYIRRERFQGSYSRSFDISGIDEEGIRAAFTDGILRLTLPKQTVTEPQPRQITIE